MLVYAPSARGFFTPDDLVYLERARHLVPPQPLTLWRFLSGPVYFALGARGLGSDAHAWLTVNVALHAVNTALLYACARRWGGSPLAAVTASVLFGASRLWLPAVQQVVTVGELGAMTFGLGALLAATANRILPAALLFTAALLCKENVLFLPLLLVWPGLDGATLRERVTRAAFLLVPATLLVLYLILARAGARTFGAEAYAAGIGPHVFHNLMTFAAWTVDLGSVVPDLTNLASSTAWHVGLPVLIALVAIAVVCWRRTRLPAIGLALWLLALVPVLPLLRHTYLFYLYVPFAGVALAVGAGWELGLQALSRRVARLRVPALALTALLLLGYVALSVARLHDRRTARIERMDIPFDPFLRKSEMARRVAEPFREAVARGTTRAVFVIPAEGFQASFATSTGQFVQPDSTSPRYDVLPAVLHQGLALRALYPTVDSVAFVSTWTAGYRDFDLFSISPDAQLFAFGRGPQAHARFALALLNARLDGSARAHLEQALTVWPNDPHMEFEHAVAVGHLGDVEGERRELAALLQRDPNGPVAGPARARLTALGPAPR